VATLVPLLVIIALFAVMVIVPGRRRARDQQQMRTNLAPGVDVMTTAGLYGRVDAIDAAQGTVDLEISDGVIVRFATQAIARVITTEQADEPTEESEDEDEPESATDEATTEDEPRTDATDDDANSPRGKDGAS
jgi:preprotein translocase subunit YajC